MIKGGGAGLLVKFVVDVVDVAVVAIDLQQNKSKREKKYSNKKKNLGVEGVEDDAIDDETVIVGSDGKSISYTASPTIAFFRNEFKLI